MCCKHYIVAVPLFDSRLLLHFLTISMAAHDVLHWPRAAAQLQQDGMTASAAHCDVSSKADVDALVELTVKQYGAVDLLISNAGIVKASCNFFLCYSNLPCKRFTQDTHLHVQARRKMTLRAGS